MSLLIFAGLSFYFVIDSLAPLQLSVILRDDCFGEQ